MTVPRPRLTPCGTWKMGAPFFAGPLDYNASHQHSVPVYLAGLYRQFRLRIEGTHWLNCRAAVVPAGLPYELDVGGNPLAVLYLEPNIASVDALTPLLRNTLEVKGALVGTTGEISLMRELYEDRGSTQWIHLALSDLTGFYRRRVTGALDPRVSRVVEYIHRHYDDLAPMAHVASSVGLSASRFQHLFTQQVGVPFRRYRAWHRLRAAIREVANGSNFTAAAYEAGFFDQAHFAHHFRRTFGAPASRGLLKVRAR